MGEPKIYLLAQFDEDANQRLSALYERLSKAGWIGEQTKGIPYHFTMGCFALEERERVVARAQAVSLRTKAFDVILSHIGLFGQRVLFIAPSMSMDLCGLYNGLVPREPEGGYQSWVAHATVLMDSPEHIRAAIPIVAQYFSPFSARIESIGVYEFFPKKNIAEYKLSP